MPNKVYRLLIFISRQAICKAVSCFKLKKKKENDMCKLPNYGCQTLMPDTGLWLPEFCFYLVRMGTCIRKSKDNKQKQFLLFGYPMVPRY